ncbi:MAG: hypothetical protein Q4F53_03450 [Nesterenkonia sp.]|nr:hypothetical protein [Nesterenkonia sp.]
MSTPPLDPWTHGSKAYRTTLLLGMGLTLLAVIMLIVGTLVGDGPISGAVYAVLGAGLLLHLISIGLRMRDAKTNIEHRKGGTS